MNSAYGYSPSSVWNPRKPIPQISISGGPRIPWMLNGACHFLENSVALLNSSRYHRMKNRLGWKHFGTKKKRAFISWPVKSLNYHERAPYAAVIPLYPSHKTPQKNSRFKQW